jgi:ABC-type microcin C transport system permease subunit YejE
LVGLICGILSYFFKGWLQRKPREKRHVQFIDRREKYWFSLKVFFVILLISYFYLLWRNPVVVSHQPEPELPAVEFNDVNSTMIDSVASIINEQSDNILEIKVPDLTIAEVSPIQQEVNLSVDPNILEEVIPQEVASLPNNRRHHTPKYHRGLVSM